MKQFFFYIRNILLNHKKQIKCVICCPPSSKYHLLHASILIFDFSDWTSYVHTKSASYKLHAVSMWAFTHSLESLDDYSWIPVAWLLSFERGLHLSLCKRHITAAMHVPSEQGATASHLQIQCSVTQSHWFCSAASSRWRACSRAALHTLTWTQAFAKTSELTFLCVTKVTSMHHDDQWRLCSSAH